MMVEMKETKLEPRKWKRPRYAFLDPQKWKRPSYDFLDPRIWKRPNYAFLTPSYMKVRYTDRDGDPDEEEGDASISFERV